MIRRFLNRLLCWAKCLHRLIIRQQVSSWGERGQLWRPSGPTAALLSNHLGDGVRQALTLNPWLVPMGLRDAYGRVVDAGLPVPVSLFDAARVAWSPVNAWSGVDAWPDGIAGDPYTDAADCYLGTDAYRQHVAVLLAVTGWDVDRLVVAVSADEGGLPLFELPSINPTSNAEKV